MGNTRLWLQRARIRKEAEGSALSTRKMQIGCNGVDACSNALREAKP